MSATAGLDILPLTWVKGEIDQELAHARRCVERFAGDPQESTQRRLARIHVHQVSGVLKMVGLEGAAAFTGEIENLLVALDEDPSLVAAACGPLERAMAALSGYLDGLVAGEADTPLVLFPVLRELRAAHGEREASEAELFFPDLMLAPPLPATLPQPSAADLAKLARSARTQFQRGLLVWLRNEHDRGGLLQMLGALGALCKVRLEAPAAGFWFAAAALVEALAQHALGAELAVKKLLGKLDLELRRLGEGANQPPERVHRELLYHLARARPLGERVRQVQQTWRLASLLPPEVQAGRPEAGLLRAAHPMARDMREALAGAKAAWGKFTSGNRDGLSVLLGHAARLKKMADQLQLAPLQRLIRVVGAAAVELRSHPERMSEVLAMEMASALLLAEGALDNLPVLPRGFPQQVEALVARVRSAALGEWDEATVPPLHDEVSRKAQEKWLLAQVGRELGANLKQAEHVLDAFFRDPSQRGDLRTLEPLYRQAQGTLGMLGLERAAQLLERCRDLTLKLAEAKEPPEAAELELLADGLSSLGFYVDGLEHESSERDRFLEPALAAFAARAAPAGELPVAAAEPPPGEAPAAAQPEPAPELALPPVSAAPPQPEVAHDETGGELVEVYLEEAAEVLERIASNRALLDRDPEDREALTEVRRGFHTLKGSGRMVGLTDLGEAAWGIEKMLNIWLEEKRLVTQRLLDLVDQAYAAFEGWLAELRASGRVTVDAEALLAQAHLLASGEPEVVPAVSEQAAVLASEQFAPLEEEEAPAVEAAAAEAPAQERLAPELPAEEVPAPEVHAAPAVEEEVAAPVRIGEVSISPALFDVYTADAEQQVAALAGALQAMRADAAAVPGEDFSRAAHTLAGISRATGLDWLADLAHALEQALLPWEEASLRPDPPALEGIGEAVRALGTMLDAVTARTLPAPETLERGAALLPELAEIARRGRTLAQPAPAMPAAPAVPELAQPELAEAQAGPARPEAERRRIRDDVDADLLPIFLAEAEDLLPQIGSGLRGLRAAPAERATAEAVGRALHTLKGSARMAGAMRLGELIHNLEGRLEAVATAPQPEALLEEVEAGYDRLCAGLDRLRGLEVEAAVAAPGEAAALPVAPEEAAAEAPRPAAVPAEAEVAVPLLRVRADRVDRLVNVAGEISIARSRVETELHSLKQSLLELTENVIRLRNQLREVEIQAESQMQSRISVLKDAHEMFDPLEFDRYTRFQELTRMMAESVNDVATVQQNLLKNLGDSENSLAQQARLSRELQQDLMGLRAVPFGAYSERLHRVVRQTAQTAGKRAALAIEGGQVEIDRGIFERLSSPLEHLLRNAVVHGIEPPAQRRAAGKDEVGRIALSVKQEGSEIAFTLRDDGGGLDLDAIHAAALREGLVSADAALSDEQKMELIFQHGLSTAGELTQVSGRGVGMDVVRSEVAALGGRVEVASERGKGTTFTVYLPLTLAVGQAVVVRCGTRSYAFAAGMVEQVQELRPEALAEAFRDGRIVWQGRDYPLHYLPRLMGDNQTVPEAHRHNKVLLLRRGARRVAVYVDDLSASREVVFKSLGPQLSMLPWVDGATVLGTGQVVLIINPVELGARVEAPAPLAGTGRAAPAEQPSAPVVMVVDDSLTVRKITGRMLAREGYQVLTARDGVEALQQVQEVHPDVMLVDIEMPRMDGFDLARTLRADPRTADIPIIIISSRTADKHRGFAEQLGVKAYFGKPYQEEELLREIAGCLRRKRGAA